MKAFPAITCSYSNQSLQQTNFPFTDGIQPPTTAPGVAVITVPPAKLSSSSSDIFA